MSQKSKCYWRTDSQMVCANGSTTSTTSTSTSYVSDPRVPEPQRPMMNNRNYQVIEYQKTPTRGSRYPPPIADWYNYYLGKK